MTTSEPERCFSALKRIKAFLRSTMGGSRLNSLAMLTVEKELTRTLPDFNSQTKHTNNVAVAHAGSKGMCTKLYKKLGKYVMISTENKYNCVPVQCNAKQAIVNEETKDDED